MHEYLDRRCCPPLNNEARTPHRRQQPHLTRPAPYAPHVLRDTTTAATKDGGLQPHGGYDFRPLQGAFAQAEVLPALVLYCEARNYRDRAGEARYAAAEALSEELGVPYAVELGSMARGPMPPAIFYNPNVLVLRRWWNADDPGLFDDQRNVARFGIRDSGPVAGTRTEFLAFVHHFEPLSGDIRLEEARRVSRYGDAQPLPVIGGGDLNAIRCATSPCLACSDEEVDGNNEP